MNALLTFLADLRDVWVLVLGFLLGLVPTWWASKRKTRTHWAALRAEIEFCSGRATIYMKDEVQAPLYRLPMKAYTASLPVLLGEGEVTESDVSALLEFYGQVEDINRGLDDAAEAHKNGNLALLTETYKRNLRKCEQLVDTGGHPLDYFTAAMTAVNAHLSPRFRLSWRKWLTSRREGTANT